MSSTLLDSTKSVFTDNLVEKVSVLLGESQTNIQSAIQGARSILLTDIVHKSYSPEGIGKINSLARQAVNSDFFGHMHELTNDTGGLVAGSALLNKGTDFARSLLAGHTDNVIQEVSRHSNISIQSASFITGLVSFASLDAIGRHIAHSNVEGSSLAAWLQTQTDSIVQATPPGLAVKSALGIQHYPWDKRVTARRNTSLYGVITLIVIVIAIFLLYRSCRTTDTVTTNSVTPDTTATIAAPATSADTLSSPRTQVSLPNGKVIDAHKGGTEDRLVAFLADPTVKLDKKNGDWFDFTGVGFASNSASLLLESETQLKNIVAILDAFPKAKIKIGGYSDNTGDSTDNVRLSQQRAGNILAKLKDLGAKSSQLTGAEGYGPQYPVGDNGTAAGRAMNRRMSINVKAK